MNNLIKLIATSLAIFSTFETLASECIDTGFSKSDTKSDFSMERNIVLDNDLKVRVTDCFFWKARSNKT